MNRVLAMCIIGLCISCSEKQEMVFKQQSTEPNNKYIRALSQLQSDLSEGEFSPHCFEYLNQYLIPVCYLDQLDENIKKRLVYSYVARSYQYSKLSTIKYNQYESLYLPKRLHYSMLDGVMICQFIEISGCKELPEPSVHYLYPYIVAYDDSVIQSIVKSIENNDTLGVSICD